MLLTTAGVWVPVDTKDTIVNVFHLQDSITMQVAHDNVPTGLLKQIRFILGTDNSVVIKRRYLPIAITRNRITCTSH